MCELARNSVIQSGWESRIKKHWIGKHWYKKGVEGNDMQKTNVPDIRVKYRHDVLMKELDMLRRYAPRKSVDLTHAAKVGLLEHDMVGAAGLQPGPQLQQNILRAQNEEKQQHQQKKDLSEENKEGESTEQPQAANAIEEEEKDMWKDSTFPGVGVVAERARRRQAPGNTNSTEA